MVSTLTRVRVDQVRWHVNGRFDPRRIVVLILCLLLLFLLLIVLAHQIVARRRRVDRLKVGVQVEATTTAFGRGRTADSARRLRDDGLLYIGILYSASVVLVSTTATASIIVILMILTLDIFEVPLGRVVLAHLKLRDGPSWTEREFTKKSKKPKV